MVVPQSVHARSVARSRLDSCPSMRRSSRFSSGTGPVRGGRPRRRRACGWATDLTRSAFGQRRMSIRARVNSSIAPSTWSSVSTGLRISPNGLGQLGWREQLNGKCDSGHSRRLVAASGAPIFEQVRPWPLADVTRAASIPTGARSTPRNDHYRTALDRPCLASRTVHTDLRETVDRNALTAFRPKYRKGPDQASR